MRVRNETIPEWVTSLEVLIDHHMLYLCGSENPEGRLEETVTEEAATSKEHVGARGGLIAVQVPMQTYVDAPVRLENWAAEPPADELWDFLVEEELPIPGERIYLWGGGGGEPVSFDLRQGVYRARIAARGFDVTEPRTAQGTFRVQLWPCGDRHRRVIK